MFSKNTPKTQRFRIWAICLLLVLFGAAYIVVGLASRPSEPPLSVRFFRVPNSVRETSGISKGMVYLFVSNNMSFNLHFGVVAESFRSKKWVPDIREGSADGFLLPHAEQRFVFSSLDEVRLSAWYQRDRQLKPIEISVFKTIPWLAKPYYAYLRHTFTVYESVSDVRISSQSKNQP